MLSGQRKGWGGHLGACFPKQDKGVGRGRRLRKREEIRNGPTTLCDTWSGSQVPLYCSEFQNHWQRCRADGERYAYLCLIGPQHLEALFRVEMEPDLFGQVLSLLCRGFPAFGRGQYTTLASTQSTRDEIGVSQIDEKEQDENAKISRGAARECTGWLRALASTGRFGINVCFLEEKEKLALSDLFQRLRDVLWATRHKEDLTVLSSLQKAFRVKLEAVG